MRENADSDARDSKFRKRCYLGDKLSAETFIPVAASLSLSLCFSSFLLSLSFVNSQLTCATRSDMSTWDASRDRVLMILKHLNVRDAGYRRYVRF